MNLLPAELACMIDHTLLKPDASEASIVQLCVEAAENHFISVCVQPFWVETARRTLDTNSASDILVCTVIGFPHGANVTLIKAEEALRAAKQCAKELDMVVNVGAIKSGQWSIVEEDIRAVVEAGKAESATVKVIIECALLTEAEKRQVTEIVATSGAAFVKTSTGYATHGATLEDVRLMREVVGTRCGVKAAGGIRDLTTALAMVEAGANRIGTSAGIAILSAARAYLQKES